MVLKDWRKSGKYNKKRYAMYVNKLPEFEGFKNNYYIVVGEEGNSGRYYTSVTKKQRQILVKRFNTYIKALRFAKSYMRKH